MENAERAAREFATLLCDNPTLSTVPIQDWTVPRLRRKFDELDAIAIVVEQLLNNDKALAGAGDLPASGAVTERPDQTGQPVIPSVATDADAVEVLFGWSEILEVVKRPEERKERDRIKRLNDDSDGPIRFPQGQGTQPEVGKAELILWWNERKNAYQNSVEENARKDAELAVYMQAEHDFGRDGTVFPEISGSKRKRKVTKSND